MAVMKRRYLLAAMPAGAAGPLLSYIDARAQTSADTDGYTAMLSDPRFRTWCGLIEAAGLAPYARGAVPYTVFAPTEQGFERYPTLRQDLLPTALSAFPDNSRLIHLIRAHVLRGKRAPETLTGSETSVAGTPITLAQAGGRAVKVSWQIDAGRQGTAVTSAPIWSVNAVIYPLDDVFLG